MSQEQQNNSGDGPIPASVSFAGSSESAAASHFVVAKAPETKFAAWLDRISDYCSSILVKETRQAIKSRQFFFTFMLLLVLVTAWSFIALSPARADYEIDSLGRFMLCGFLWILGLPMVLIIPYTTFRSLAQEYEDGTIDMVQITTMKPRQIIAGKLGSAMLQVLLYVSVVAPCIAFSYLLRGVDIYQIWLSLGGGVIVTFGLCCLSIALASASNTRMIRQVLSVFLILGLLFCAWCWCALAMVICYEPIGAGQQGLVALAMSGPALAWLSSAAVLFCAASAQIAFASSNRSTALRIGVLIQVVLYFGYLLALFATFGFNEEGFLISCCFGMQYLLLVGSMMIGCHRGLSPRVRRTLPQTFFSRSFTALFYPGPGRAYLFMVALATSLSCAMAIIAYWHESFDLGFVAGTNQRYRSSFTSQEAIFACWSALTNLLYFLFFFSLMFLISRFWAARHAATRKPFVIEMAVTAALLVAFATIGSYALSPDEFWRMSNPSELSQVFNWYRIQYFVSLGNDLSHILLLVAIPTIPMFFLCIRIASQELVIASTMVPDRVLEEDEQFRQERRPREDYDDETIDEIFAAVRPPS